jgi:hypothetical protein
MPTNTSELTTPTSSANNTIRPPTDEEIALRTVMPDPEMKFFQEIDALIEKGTGVLEAVIHYCAKNCMEPEMAGTIINKNLNLKAKLQQDFEALHFLKKSRRLAI